MKKNIITAIFAIVVVASILLAIDITRPQSGPSHINGNYPSKSQPMTAENEPANFTTSTIIPLKAGYITEYALPNDTGPNGILVDRNGLVWTAGSMSHKLYSLNPKSLVLRSYQIPEEETGDYMTWSIVQDNDGFIWFSQFGAVPLWRFDPNTGNFSKFDEPTAAPFQMKFDSKTDEIWFTTLTGNTLGVVEKTKGNGNESRGYMIREFPTGNGVYPSGLIFRGNSVWVTELEKGKVARFDVIRSSDGLVAGVKKTLEIPSKDQFSAPTDLLFSEDGTLWITEHGTSTISEYNIKSRNLTRFSTSQNIFHVASLPFWMHQSNDGKGIWFNEHEGQRVTFLDLEKMDLTEYSISSHQSIPIYILNSALDPHDPNKMWFSEWNADRIGVVDRSIPVPFDIKTNATRIILSDTNASQEMDAVNFQVTGNNTALNTILSINASSSMEPDGGFANMSATFPEGNTLDVNGTGKQQFELLLDNHSAPQGNYTLGISVTDGAVTRTIFLDLVVKP